MQGNSTVADGQMLQPAGEKDIEMTLTYYNWPVPVPSSGSGAGPEKQESHCHGREQLQYSFSPAQPKRQLLERQYQPPGTVCERDHDRSLGNVTVCTSPSSPPPPQHHQRLELIVIGDPPTRTILQARRKHAHAHVNVNHVYSS